MSATPASSTPRPARVRRWALEAAVVLLGVVLGLGSLWWWTRSVSTLGTAAGPWRASLLAGSADADPWTRLRVAVGGLLALTRSETLYYLADHDSTGQPLRTRCRYRVHGTPPDARWWSITAYAGDHFLIANDERRYSVNGATAALDAQGRFSVSTGPVAPGGGTPWLPTPGDHDLLLALRVYNPGMALQADPATLAPPRIDLLGACP